MRTIGEIARAIREDRRIRRAKLPWHELEAEAARQGCSPDAIFFDRAVALFGLPRAGDQDVARGGRQGAT
jgi:hypothetical protein